MIIVSMLWQNFVSGELIKQFHFPRATQSFLIGYSFHLVIIEKSSESLGFKISIVTYQLIRFFFICAKEATL